MAAKAIAVVLNKLRRSFLLHDTVSLTDGELLGQFVSRRDEIAFETLLHRHGPMVLGVCRRILQNETDAEDAFQSTFLVLVRKAQSVRPPSLVGNWLYGVAHSTALKARAMRSKRLAKEKEAAAHCKPEMTAETWQQLEAMLDHELKALPEKYRSAIVLCDLEGKSIKEAGQQLGCPAGTIGTRLGRGRAMLARRLARHGLMVSTGMLAAVLSQNACASVPAPLVMTTCKGAAVFAAGATATGGMFSAKVAGLTESMLKSMLLAKLRIATAVLLIPLLIGTAGVGFYSLTQSGDGPVTTVDHPTKKEDDRRLLVCAKQVDNEIAKETPSEFKPPALKNEISKRPVSEKESAVALAGDVEKKRQETDAKKTTTKLRKGSNTKATMKLPPGLAMQPVSHPGRVAWLKAHGSPDGKTLNGS